MIEAITDDGYLHWRCILLDSLDGELLSCGEEKTCHIDDVVYREAPQANRPGGGAMIDLPKCACGLNARLKADYTLKELYKSLICCEEDGMRAFVLPMRYVLNLQIHWMLYQRGKAAHPPVLEMPPQALLEHSAFAGIKLGTVYALWFGFAAMKQYAPQELEASKVLLLGA